MPPVSFASVTRATVTGHRRAAQTILREGRRGLEPGRVRQPVPVRTGRGRRFTLLATMITMLLTAIAGCASGPGERFDALIEQHGLKPATMQGTSFLHLYVRKPARRDMGGLHVYLAGDGSPWIRRRHIAVDPTSRDPLTLRLMLRDPERALYLGRPCYHRVDASPPCHPAYWTHGRYSKAVVDSMAAALKRLLEMESDTRAITLYGFSGGGTLAMLLAQRMDDIDRVVTVAANLDTDAWARLHGYTPLSSSLNPAKERSLRSGVEQLHLAGSIDTTVPPDLATKALRHQPGAELAVITGFDHRCCWEDRWPAIVHTAQQPRSSICQALDRALPLTSCGHATGSAND